MLETRGPEPSTKEQPGPTRLSWPPDHRLLDGCPVRHWPAWREGLKGLALGPCGFAVAASASDIPCLSSGGWGPKITVSLRAVSSLCPHICPRLCPNLFFLQ